MVAKYFLKLSHVFLFCCFLPPDFTFIIEDVCFEDKVVHS